ncbi:MAG: DUF262 domain-containing protein [Acidimicrobiales bacterium]
MPPQFRAEPSTLRSLIWQPGQGFYVPMYQRDFTWGSTEIRRLFEDLHYGMARAAAGHNPSTFLGTIITVEDPANVAPRNQDAVPAQVLHVVDGQQRLTTLLIVFAVLARNLAEHHGLVEVQVAAAGGSPDAVAQWLLNRLRQSIESLLDAISIDLVIGEAEYRFKPRLIRQDTDVWGNTMATAKYDSDIAWYLMETIRNRHLGQARARVTVPQGRPHLEQIVRQIEGEVSDILQGDTECETVNDLSFLTSTTVTDALVGSNPGPITDPTGLDSSRQEAFRLLATASFLFTGVLVIDVRAPDEDYAFSLFEPLNTTGQLLTALETLKPLVVQAEGGVVGYSMSPSLVEVAKVESYFPPELRNDEKSKRISDWLVSFALNETGTRLSRSLLDQRGYLRSEYRSPGTGPDPLPAQREFLGAMAESAVFFFDVWRDPHPAFLASASDFDRIALEVLRSSNHSIVVPVLSRYYSCWAHEQSESAKGDFLEVLRAVAVFWTLWRTSRPTTKGIDDIHRGLMARGLDGTPALSALARRPGGQPAPAPLPSPAELRAALRSLLASRGHIVQKQDWVGRAATQPIYQTAKNLAKFLLLCSHEDFVEDQSEPGLIAAGVPGVFHCLSVGTWNAHYSVEHVAPQAPAPGDSTYETLIYDRGLIDRLGNLTLMPTDLNQLVGNRSWSAKRELYGVLSESSAQDRLDHLEATLGGLAPATRELLLSAAYLPFCRSIALNSSPVLTAHFLEARSERLAGLAFDRLWQYLQ